MDSTLPLDSFRVHDELNPVVWDDDHLRPEVRKKLLEVADRFEKHLGVPVKVKDVWLTGSAANYNWSPYSDIDLHLLLDFKKIDEDEELVRELMLAKKDVWNDRHDVRIGPFEVELYAQDIHEPHEATGVYSVKNDKWIRKPKKESPEIDLRAVVRKARSMMRRIDRALDNPECGYECLDKTMDRIKKMRQCGLQKRGEYSTENLAFKILRRNGYLEKLSDQKLYRLDDELSMRVAKRWVRSQDHGRRG